MKTILDRAEAALECAVASVGFSLGALLETLRLSFLSGVDWARKHAVDRFLRSQDQAP